MSEREKEKKITADLHFSSALTSPSAGKDKTVPVQRIRFTRNRPVGIVTSRKVGALGPVWPVFSSLSGLFSFSALCTPRVKKVKRKTFEKNRRNFFRPNRNRFLLLVNVVLDFVPIFVSKSLKSSGSIVFFFLSGDISRATSSKAAKIAKLLCKEFNMRKERCARLAQTWRRLRQEQFSA